MIIIEMIQEVFPEANQVFVYRDSLEVAVPLRQIAPLMLISYLPNLPNFVVLIGDFLGLHNTEFRGWTCVVHP